VPRDAGPPLTRGRARPRAQGLLCGVLQVIVQRLSEQEASKAGVLQFADPAMEALLGVFACRSASVHEEALLAAGALTYACGPQFVKYLERFFPVLEMGLANHKARARRAGRLCAM
jgi:importin subunit beta-1